MRAVKGLHGKPISDWSFAIGIWSFPRLIANGFADNPGQCLASPVACPCNFTSTFCSRLS